MLQKIRLKANSLFQIYKFSNIRQTKDVEHICLTATLPEDCRTGIFQGATAGVFTEVPKNLMVNTQETNLQLDWKSSNKLENDL
jgi:hypothetical protein